MVIVMLLDGVLRGPGPTGWRSILMLRTKLRKQANGGEAGLTGSDEEGRGGSGFCASDAIVAAPAQGREMAYYLVLRLTALLPGRLKLSSLYSSLSRFGLLASNKATAPGFEAG
ncbi:hypothetical protein V8C42DRAFT_321038 [Trichoderma barbatum]